MKPLFSDSEPYPPVYQAATLFKNYKGCRDLHARIMLHPKFSNGRYTGTGQLYQDKKAQKRWDRHKTIPSAKLYYQKRALFYFSAISGIGFL